MKGISPGAFREVACFMLTSGNRVWKERCTRNYRKHSGEGPEAKSSDEGLVSSVLLVSSFIQPLYLMGASNYLGDPLLSFSFLSIL